MRKLLFILLFTPLFAFGQIGQLPYQFLKQVYRGDTVSVKLNSDSVNYHTNKNSFRFDKDIYVKGIKLGGGSTGIPKYLKNYNSTDTVISIVAPASSVGIHVSSTLANQCIKVYNSFMYGTGILSYTTGSEGVAGRFDATGSTATTAYGVRINSRIAIPFAVDSLNINKFLINSSGIPKITNFAGTGNRSLIAKSDGSIGIGLPTVSSIPSQLKNYNVNQDTVIRFPNLASGKFGIWADVNNGYVFKLNTNNSFIKYIGTNAYIGTWVQENTGFFWEKIQNNRSGAGGYGCDNNEGTFANISYNAGFGLSITQNSGTGVYIVNSIKTGIGIKSFAADSVSTTSPCLTGTFGKTTSHLDIDGFGHAKLIQSAAPTITLGIGAGTGATYTLISGSTDKAGVISVTTGTAPSSTGIIFTITYANAYKGMAVFMAVPGNSEASSVQGATRPHMIGYDKASSGLTTSGTALNPSTTYIWHYCVMQ